MPDDIHSRMPRTWADAFATLPDATVPDGGWSRLEAVLDATASPAHASIYGVRRRRGLVALAASLALVATVPWLMRTDDTVPSSSSPRVAPVARVAGPMASDGSRGLRSLPSTVDDVAPVAGAVAGGGPPRVAAPHRGRRTAPERASFRIDEASIVASTPAASGTMPATRDAGREAKSPATRSDDAGAAAQPTATVLAPLHAEAAQLEALIALARDDRVESATASVLADDLDMRIGLIDAALAEPGLSAPRRAALWQQRVSTLRDMAGMESTERWLAANGTTSLGALVRVD